MIEHWRISAVYFTCNQVGSRTEAEQMFICRLQRSKDAVNAERTPVFSEVDRRPNFAQENEWCVDA